MKSLLSTCLVLLATAAVFASKPVMMDINAALGKAKAEHKMLFLQYGRENCENCQALKAMIDSKKVSLPESKFVYADVNCDDKATTKVFASKFSVKGRELPFVVVASPEGKQLAGHSGFMSESDFNKLIQTANKKAK